MSFSPKQSNAEIIDLIVAQVGEKVVTLNDVEVFAPAVVRSIYSMTDDSEQEEAWDKYFNETIDFMIYDVTLQTAAARIGISATEEEIQEMIPVLQEQNTAFRAQVREILDREGAVTPELYLFVKQLILKTKVNLSLATRAIVTEDDVIDYLKNEPSLGYGSDEYNVKLAFLPDEAAYGRLLEYTKTVSFTEAAAAVGSSAIDMGWVRNSDLAPAIRAAVSSMQNSDLSSVSDESGNIIAIKLEDMRTVSTISESMRSVATYALKEKQKETIFQRWLDRQKQSIVVYRYR